MPHWAENLKRQIHSTALLGPGSAARVSKAAATPPLPLPPTSLTDPHVCKTTGQRFYRGRPM